MQNPAPPSDPPPAQQTLLDLADPPGVQNTVATTRVVRIEKNLNSLGFFSSTASTGQRKQEKVITVTRELPGGIKSEAKATIMGTSRGLPNTADLDKYIAFQSIVAELRKKNGVVQNPIGFTTYQLLRALGLKPTGKRYAEVDQWLDRMAGTLIKSEGAVYLARTKRYVRDRFHVFEKVFTAGEVLPDGHVAEQNYVFLSDWQLENLNHGYVLPIALEYYQQLRSDIAKNLVPLLYIWFYASRRPFQKRYLELCQQLNIKVWSQFSRANEQLSPALNELQQIGYISEWELCRTVDGTDLKLIFVAGPIFRDQPREDFRQRDDSALVDADFNARLALLVARGVAEKAARRLLFGLSDDARIEEQVEWIDSIIESDPKRFENPAGMYVTFLRDGILPPADFLSSRRRKEQTDADATTRATAAAAIELENRYAEFREEQVQAYIGALSAETRVRLEKDSRKAAAKSLTHFDLLSREQQDNLAARFAFRLVVDEIPVLTLEEFRNARRPEQPRLPSSDVLS